MRDCAQRATARDSSSRAARNFFSDPVSRNLAGHASPRQLDPRVTTATRHVTQYTIFYRVSQILCRLLHGFRDRDTYLP